MCSPSQALLELAWLVGGWREMLFVPKGEMGLRCQTSSPSSSSSSASLPPAFSHPLTCPHALHSPVSLLLQWTQPSRGAEFTPLTSRSLNTSLLLLRDITASPNSLSPSPTHPHTHIHSHKDAAPRCAGGHSPSARCVGARRRDGRGAFHDGARWQWWWRRRSGRSRAWEAGT